MYVVRVCGAFCCRGPSPQGRQDRYRIIIAWPIAQSTVALGLDGENEDRQKSVTGRSSPGKTFRGVATSPSRRGWPRSCKNRQRDASTRDRRSEVYRVLTGTFSRNRSMTNIVRNNSFIAMLHPKELLSHSTAGSARSQAPISSVEQKMWEGR